MQGWLPEDHLAYFISDIADQLDLSEITARYEQERRGGAPYNPRMMVKVLLYGYCIGVSSSRRMAQRLHEDIAFRVQAANNAPDFRTISDFRKDHLAALSGLFLQVLMLCSQAGLVKLGHVVLDSTKVRANASKHKAMSYKRMKEREGQLAAEVAELLRHAQEVDEEEDHRYGRDKGERVAGGVVLPGGSAGARSGRPWRRWKPRPRPRRKQPRQRARRILECRMTRPSATSPTRSPASCPLLAARTSSKPTIVRRNCRAVVDHEHKVIVATRATDVASDKG